MEMVLRAGGESLEARKTFLRGCKYQQEFGLLSTWLRLVAIETGNGISGPVDFV